MSEAPVAIILTVLNEGNGLRPLIESFLRQSHPPDEVVFVDGGSSDSTVSILEEYARRDGRVRVFVAPGVNIARGRNLAIAQSQGEILAVTDGGCRPELSWLENLVKPLLADAAIGAVAGFRRIDAANTFERFAGLLSTSSDPGNDFDRLFFGRSSAFRRGLWQEVGGYPEWLYTGEDTLFALRAKSLGYSVAYAPNSVVNWRPRNNWLKLIKQYFLYGKGTGRIDRSDLSASMYHVRNHLIWLLAFFVGCSYPLVWVISTLMIGYIYWYLVLPTLKEIRRTDRGLSREFYVPAIVFARSFFHNLGQLLGAWEYRFRPPFRRNLVLYMKGLWQPTLPWTEW